MTISLDRARDYVFTHGMLWERALFSWRFDDGPLEQLQRCLLCYKNADGGWGHGLEHDLKAPLSHPAALEYLLGVLRYHDIPPGTLLDGTVAWLERQQQPDGSLRNPTELGNWPLAPWWTEWGGQKQPDSIVGNLHALGLATPRLQNATRHWAEQHHSLEGIRSNDWLFMTYHAFDYFMNIDDFPQLAGFRAATLAHTVALAETLIPKRHYTLFFFAPDPASAVARALPEAALTRCLDTLATTQREDGGWADEHDLPQWQPVTTINVLTALQRYGGL